MRVADRPIPAYSSAHSGPLFVDWPMSLHLIVEAESLPIRWDADGIYWDDARVLWDADQTAADMVDLACDLIGVDIEHGPPDDLTLYPSGTMTATLADRTGTYSRYRPDGTLSKSQLGRRIGIVLETNGAQGFDPDERAWLFYGRIVAWTEGPDETVEVAAFNVPNDMTTMGPFTPGTNGQHALARIGDVMAAAEVVERMTRGDAGTVALTAQLTSRTPYEECQSVALSDGGILFADTDDVLTYYDRDWRDGRPDQTRFYTLSDNVCTADFVVWFPELSTNDETLATAVLLKNVAGLEAFRTLAANPFNTETTLTHPDPDQWTTQAEGDALAQYLIDNNSVAMVEVVSMALMVDDPRFPRMWAMAADTRIGDRHEFVHDYRPSGQLRVGIIVNHVAHSITAEQWMMTLGAWSYLLPPATIGVAGSPGYWTDADGKPALAPPTFADLGTVTASPVTWAAGEYAVLADGTEVHHDAAGWHLGRAPVPAPSLWHVGHWQRSTWASVPASDWDDADALWDDESEVFE